MAAGGTLGPTGSSENTGRYGSTHSILRHMSDNTLQMLAAGGRIGGSQSDEVNAITSPVLVKKTRPTDPQSDALKAQDFQVSLPWNRLSFCGLLRPRKRPPEPHRRRSFDWGHNRTVCRFQDLRDNHRSAPPGWPKHGPRRLRAGGRSTEVHLSQGVDKLPLLQRGKTPTKNDASVQIYSAVRRSGDGLTDSDGRTIVRMAQSPSTGLYALLDQVFDHVSQGQGGEGLC